MQRPDGGMDVVDVRKRLRADHTVEHPRRELPGLGEVGDQRGVRVARVYVEDVDLLDRSTASELRCVGAIADLEDLSADARGMLTEELLDVVAIDRQPALEPELVADRRDAAEAPEPDAADRRPL